MKNWKVSLLTAFSFIAISAMVILSSCEQDPCSDLNCQNGGACSDGLCQCPTGWEGAECDIPASSRFVGSFAGSVRCDNFPIQTDTVTIDLVNPPNEINLRLGFGNTALLAFHGIAETPETHFVTHIDEFRDIHAYVTADGNLLYIFLETIDKQFDERQICRFTGMRILPAE
jgi:hypothetical protein